MRPGVAAVVPDVEPASRAGERRWHATGPLALSALSLGCMAMWIDGNSMLAFGALLLATSLWGPAGILSSLPATFLKVTFPASTCPWHRHSQGDLCVTTRMTVGVKGILSCTDTLHRCLMSGSSSACLL